MNCQALSVSKVTVMKAIVLPDASPTSEPEKKAAAVSKVSSGSTSKSKTTTSGGQAKPKSTKSASSPKKSQPTQRTAPATNTVQDKIRQTANEVGNSIRAFISP